MRHIKEGAVIKIVIILCAAAVFLLIIHNHKRLVDILYPFLMSFFIAYLLNPLVSKLESTGLNRRMGILIIFFAVVLIIVFTCFFMGPALVKDLGKLMGSLPEYSAKLFELIKNWQDGVRGIGLPSAILGIIDSNFYRIQNYIASYIASFTNLIIRTLSRIFSIALIPVLVYYFLKDFKNISEKIFLILPKKYRYHAERIGTSIDCIFGNYVRGQLLLSFIVSAMTTVALFVIGVDYALIIGVINGITNIIPYFGPVIGAVPAVIVAFLESPVKALYTIIAIIIIQQIESDLICPKITGNSVGLHPLTVMFALVAGGELFGATGLILGVPVVAAIKVIYRDIMKNMF